MDKFSISQLSQYSGIKPHTIRIWEQRYNALQPDRSPGNTRYYDNDQLKRLLNIVSLLEYNYKVSDLCMMSDEQLFLLIDKLEKKVPEDQKYGYYISQLISAGVSYDEFLFEKIFGHCLLAFGFKESYTEVIIPLMNRIGLMWATSKLPPAQEHFISNLVRQKIFVAIDSLPPPKVDSPTTLLYLPEYEFHEIPLLFAHFLMRFHGQRSIYLGANVPFISLKESINSISPDNLLFFLVHDDVPENVDNYLRDLEAVYPGHIYLAGNTSLLKNLNIQNTNKIQIFHSVDDLEKLYL